jgi:hypothetical protein
MKTISGYIFAVLFLILLILSQNTISNYEQIVEKYKEAANIWETNAKKWESISNRWEQSSDKWKGLYFKCSRSAVD